MNRASRNDGTPPDDLLQRIGSAAAEKVQTELVGMVGHVLALADDRQDPPVMLAIVGVAAALVEQAQALRAVLGMARPALPASGRAAAAPAAPGPEARGGRRRRRRKIRREKPARRKARAKPARQAKVQKVKRAKRARAAAVRPDDPAPRAAAAPLELNGVQISLVPNAESVTYGRPRNGSHGAPGAARCRLRAGDAASGRPPAPDQGAVGGAPPSTADTVLSQVASEARQALAPIGLDVRTVKGVGIALAVAER